MAVLEAGQPPDADDAPIVIQDTLVAIRNRRAQKLMIASNVKQASFHASLAKPILPAPQWFEQLRDRRVASITELAKQEDLPRAWISHQLPLALLAPDIIETIASGRQPTSLTVDRLTAIANASPDWAAQRAAIT